MPLIRKPAGAPSTGVPARDSAAVLLALASGTDDERWAAARSAAELPGRRGGPRRGARAGKEPTSSRGAVHGTRPSSHSAERRDCLAVPALRRRIRAHGSLGRPDGDAKRRLAGHCGPAAGPRYRRAHSRLQSRPQHARRNGPAACSATCSIRSRSRTSAPRPSTRWRRSAEQRRYPCWRAARSVLRQPLFSNSRSRSRWIASAPRLPAHVPEFPALTEDEYRRLCEFLYRRTGMVFTEAKRYYVERRVVERMLAVKADFIRRLFRASPGRPAGRDRAVRQRVHGERDVLLPRGAPARVLERPTCWPPG